MRPWGVVVGRALMALGVGVLVVVTWSRFLRGDAGVPFPVALAAAAVLVGGVVLTVWGRGRRAVRGQTVIAERRPGWTLHQVWADAGLSDALVRQGVWEPGMSPAGGTRLTLAWSAVGVELWRAGRDPHVILALPWERVAAVTEGTGRAASSSRPAVVLATLEGAELVLVPAARPDGALLPGGRPAVQQLVVRLRAARDGTTGSGPRG